MARLYQAGDCPHVKQLKKCIHNMSSKCSLDEHSECFWTYKNSCSVTVNPNTKTMGRQN